MSHHTPFVVDAVVAMDSLGEGVRAARVHHEWFGDLVAPEGLSDLSALMLIVSVGWGATGWRGQARLNWTIESSLVRRVRRRSDELGTLLETPDELELVVGEVEARLLGRAQLAGHDNHGALSDLELSAVLQHHGAGTRLLDCTTNALIAMWFAARDHRGDWGLLIGFDTRNVEPILTAQQRDRPMQQIIQDLRGSAGRWNPAALSPRMPAQQGFFVFSAAREHAWGSLAATGDSMAETGNVPGMSLIAIRPYGLPVVRRFRQDRSAPRA